MRAGRHFLADGFTEQWVPSGGPRFIQTDNMDFQRNIEIERVDIMYTAPEGGQKDFSGDVIFFVLGRTEESATPQAITPNVRIGNFGLRMNDPDIIAWGTLNPQSGSKVILSPYNIVPTNMWVNAWSLTNAHSLDSPSNDMGYAIWMKIKNQSGTEGLLQTTLNVAAQQNS